jgi:hypothetical protein
MTDNSTITDMGLPSFVRQLREVDDNLVACFDLWAPTVTGYAPLDHDLGACPSNRIFLDEAQGS